MDMKPTFFLPGRGASHGALQPEITFLFDARAAQLTKPSFNYAFRQLNLDNSESINQSIEVLKSYTRS